MARSWSPGDVMAMLSEPVQTPADPMTCLLILAFIMANIICHQPKPGDSGSAVTD